MPFDPNADNKIQLSEASVFTSKYRRKFPDTVKANAYGKRQMLELLNQADCEGFRIYNGLSNDGDQVLVIVGVDIRGNDLYEGILIDRSQPCPSVCSTDNPLNKDM
jgi:hypothetical protein